MLAVILKILSILGIVLLILLAVVLLLLCIVLFMPIVYRFDGAKSADALTASAKARWMFGLLRATYGYPEPDRILVKVLWFTIYDSKAEKKDSDIQAEDKTQINEGQTEEANKTSLTAEEKQKTVSSDSIECNPSGDDSTAENPSEGQQNEAEEGKLTLFDKILAKIEKIKYTFRKICDKIKHILKEYEFYKKLFEDEQSQELFAHGLKRTGKILRHIRPRKLKANITFGTGSPDTTGYAYGLYGMISPSLGKDVIVIPDFEEQILVGTIQAAGHITIFTLLINVLAVLLDKRLRLFMTRLKKHNASHK